MNQHFAEIIDSGTKPARAGARFRAGSHQSGVHGHHFSGRNASDTHSPWRSCRTRRCGEASCRPPCRPRCEITQLSKYFTQNHCVRSRPFATFVKLMEVAVEPLSWILTGQSLPFAPLNISDIQQMYGVRIEASYQKYPTAYVPPPMISKIMTAVLDISEHQTNPGVIGMNEPTRMDYIYQVRGCRRISASHKQNCVSEIRRWFWRRCSLLENC